MVHRLKQSEIAEERRRRLAEQGGRCALCKETVRQDEAVLDHCHKSGRIRAVLHRGCNACLGHIENNMPRHKLTDIRRLSAFLRSIPAYLWADYQHEPLHHTHRTEEEKRLKRNAKARKARVAKKE